MNTIIRKLIKLPISVKYFIIFTNDIFIILFSFWASFSLRLSYFYNPFNGSAIYREYLPYFFSEFFIYQKLFDIVLIYLLAPLIFIPISIYFGLGSVVIRFISYKGVSSIVKTVFLYSLILGFIVHTLNIDGIPRSIVIINFFISCLVIIFSRYAMRFILRKSDFNLIFFNRSNTNRKAAIVGANQNGKNLVESISYLENYNIYCFFDNDKKIIGRKIFDLPVLDLANLEFLIQKEKITDIFLSISRSDQKFRKNVISSLSNVSVRVRSIPDFFDLSDNKIRFEDLQELDINDLLARETVQLNFEQINKKLLNKKILITGAGGSIGSELCRQIVLFQPKKIILFEQSEYYLYEIQNNLQKLINKLQSNNDIIKKDLIEIVPVLGSIQDYKLLETIFNLYNPEIVYHAAAYKHVPIVEKNVSEGLKNNIFGSLNVALVAIKFNVQDFVLISTDKAVRPTNLMGASKRFAELILQSLSNEKKITFSNDVISLNNINNTNFCIVRFGNVLGSSGSVVPLFKNQIKNGGPLTVTHPEVTRYFMSIDEAAKLVIQSTCINKNKKISEIFVLDMGEPVKIYDLAIKMIKYSGLTIKDQNNPDGDIEIKIIGLRSAEKLYEELLIGNNPINTSHNKIFKARENFIEWNILKVKLSELANNINSNNTNEIYKILKNLVIGYNPKI